MQSDVAKVQLLHVEAASNPIVNSGVSPVDENAAPMVAVSDSIRILQSVRRIAQCVEHHSKRMTVTHSITSPQLVALMAIAQIGPSTLKSIGRAIYLSPSTVVGIVDRLEEKELVVRTRDTRDRRNVYVSVTEAGRALVDNAPSALPDGFGSALSALPEDAQDALVVALEQFATLLEVKAAPPA